MNQNDENTINSSENSDSEIEDTDYEDYDIEEPSDLVMFNVFKEMEDRRRRSNEFLNGRNAHELSDEEFDKLQEISENNYFDKRNPEHIEIMENREIFYEREEYLKIHNDRTETDRNADEDRWYGLNLYSIFRDIDYIGSIASKYPSHNFYFTIVSHLAFIHEMRKLHFRPEYAKAIADPDQATMSDDSMNGRGVIFYGRYAYDLNLEVTLDKREYDDMHLKDAFCLFFALRLSQIDIMHTATFLDYQLKVTFGSNFEKFKSFLIPLSIKYKTIELSAFGKEEKEILTPEIVDIVKDWIRIKTNANFLPPPTTEQEGEFLPENWRVIKGKLTPEQIKYILSFLYKETGNDTDGKAFLKETEFEELLKYGFAYPKEKRNQPFKLEISTKRTVKTIYYCFYCLYQALDKDFIDKNDIVNFLINNFENFNIENRQTIYENIKNTRPAKMKFDILMDYIDKAKQIKPT